jgi:hypothetical protein
MVCEENSFLVIVAAFMNVGEYCAVYMSDEKELSLLQLLRENNVAAPV